ncbi:MAG: heme a synthase [Actinomycetota bacterium]|jgi:cytochrome c oxidase assembly protein subunit 15|nr:heme a synthase [Actinomycetota bacterium]
MDRPSVRTVRRLALASIVANAAIVVTGGAVRLTDSGLGCPTWPRCTESTYTPTAASDAHGLIEFGNRLLTFVLVAVVAATVVAVVRQRPRRPALVRLAALLVLGIPAQAVLGGITVRTGLNPWTVMGHFLLSALLIAVAVALHWRSGEGDAPPRPLVPRPLRQLSYAVLAVVATTLVAGTVVTGSGPHSGDAKAARTGFNPESVSQLHADLVMLLVGLSIAMWLALRAQGGPSRAAGILVLVVLSQGAVGWTQYFTDLPVALVAVHMAGACLVLIAAVRVVLSLRERMAQGSVTVPFQSAELADA